MFASAERGEESARLVVNIMSKVFPLFSGLPRLQEVGCPARVGARPAGAQHDARPAVLPQLRPDLVRLHEAGGRGDQDQVQRPLPGPHQGPGPAVKLSRILSSLRL